MFCNACGQRNAEGSLFCLKCGAALDPAGEPRSRLDGYPTTHSSDDSTLRQDIDPEHDWIAVIGPKNQEKYLEHFRRIHAAGGGLTLSWHWPAFFVTFYWLLYRRMWGWALGYFVLPSVIGLLIGLVAGLLGLHAIDRLLLPVYFALLFVIPPLLANWLYYRHCHRLILSGNRALSRERQWARLEARGGTSAAALIVIAVFTAVGLIGMLAAIALPAYRDYVKRAQMLQLVSAATSLANEVGSRYEAGEPLPEHLGDLPSHPGLPPHATGMSIDKQGRIEVRTTIAIGNQPASLYLVPTADAARHVTWRCHADAGLQRFVPPACRERD